MLAALAAVSELRVLVDEKVRDLVQEQLSRPVSILLVSHFWLWRQTSRFFILDEQEDPLIYDSSMHSVAETRISYPEMRVKHLLEVPLATFLKQGLPKKDARDLLFPFVCATCGCATLQQR